MPAASFNFASVIILSGAVQGLFLCVCLIARAGNRKANRWLAALLCVISLHLLEYAASITGLTFEHPFLMAVTYPLLFAMG
ncbi:MAG TPA: hypothetical protein VEB40_02480, partial [Flavipsychrobacter sp.]|nr:hypothetical protein [Flavipsychrobacter sp.]